MTDIDWELYELDIEYRADIEAEASRMNAEHLDGE